MGLSIKEASKRLDIPPHTIRYYEKEGLLPFIQRDEHGNRIFEHKDLDWIKLMTCFRVTGMPIAALKHIVDLALQGDSTIPERKAVLEKHKMELQKRQMELDLAFEAVENKLNKYNSIQNGTSDSSTFDMNG
ncbi:MerR family transcriptional regulator [Paenibacillus psychroresistens]|uniref:MerR family transcriptional regulator n=1 Tax=Paenibacillus psychroresistens TaxID=1778678 RepID=A0A6B8RMZ4_9BACL|nr:MerR family transcriptional regulator [Paenibacillus psychroresistens]QGQ97680.1 MerR family transcriptional regulator [Paenibacillus psychroresistens]